MTQHIRHSEMTVLLQVNIGCKSLSSERPGEMLLRFIWQLFKIPHAEEAKLIWWIYTGVTFAVDLICLQTYPFLQNLTDVFSWNWSHSSRVVLTTSQVARSWRYTGWVWNRTACVGAATAKPGRNECYLEVDGLGVAPATTLRRVDFKLNPRWDILEHTITLGYSLPLPRRPKPNSFATLLYFGNRPVNAAQ